MKWLSIILLCASTLWAQIPLWSWQVVDSLPHDPQRFTQGLLWHNSELWECTGLVGKSAIYRSDRQGRVLAQQRIPAPHFGEGCAVYGNALVVLTWQSQVGFIYDLQSLEKLGEFPVRGEGWGLTLKNDFLWLSNGSANLYRLDPRNMQVRDSVAVRAGPRLVANLNELESTPWGIVANVWYSDSLAVIDETTGQVQAWLDLRALRGRTCGAGTRCDVLNGVAWDGKYLWVTGKNWPRLWALQITKVYPKSSGTPRP